MSLALANLFYYQNPNTNLSSSNAVSAKQLCRILCPANQNSKTTNNHSFLDQATLVIAFDPITNTHDSNGWKPIHQVPLLKEACASWYYEDNLPTTSDNAPLDQLQTQNVLPSTEGPISCRELAALYYNTENNFLHEIRVWSAQASSDGWKTMRELPDLMNAMEAFEDYIDMHLHTDDNADNNLNEAWKENFTGKVKSALLEKDSGTHAHPDATSAGAEEKDLLDNFFSSTARPEDKNHSEQLDEEEEEYESDGGTTYVKDIQSGEWINAKSYTPNKKRKLQAQSQYDGKSTQEQKTKEALLDINKNKKKNKKPKFKARNAKCWVYVTNLPTVINEQELAEFFKKVGVLDIDPNTLREKVKLYRYKGGEKIASASASDEISNVLIATEGMPKGDASVCYARSESVELALQLLDDSPFRTMDASGKFIANPQRISVQRAKFEMHGKEFKGRKKVSDVKRKVARLAKLQAVGWDDGENGRITGGLKGLRIIVLQNVFDALALRGIEEVKEDAILKGVEKEIFETCSDLGTVEKITIFTKNRRNAVVIVKFIQPTAAGEAIQEYNGKSIRQGKTIEASYWDGVTDYTVRNEEQETKNAEKRLDEFGNWLDNQELPEEFQLQVEGS